MFATVPYVSRPAPDPAPALDREEWVERQIAGYTPTVGPILTVPTVATLPSGHRFCPACQVSWSSDDPCWSCHPGIASQPAEEVA
jgi:hypothetical protein